MSDQIEMWMGDEPEAETDAEADTDGEDIPDARRSLHLRAATDGNVTEVIASTTIEDRYGDVVAPPWKLGRIRQNPVVFWGHRYDTPPVGKIANVKVREGRLLARIRWDDSPDNPLGQLVARQYRDGFLSGVSVGFNPGDTTPRRNLPEDHAWHSKSMGNVYQNNELLEISAVGIPANPEALAVKGLPAPNFQPDEIARMVEDRVRASVREDLVALLAADRLAAEAIERVLGDGEPSPERVSIRAELIRLLNTDTEARQAVESVLILSPHAPTTDQLVKWWTA